MSKLIIHVEKVELQDRNKWYVKYSSYDKIANRWGKDVKSLRHKQLLELKLPAFQTKNAIYIEFNDPIDEAEFIMKYSEGIEVDDY